MKPNLFISYSRREVGFVDELCGRLEEEGYATWLDYRSLVPGKPWKQQILDGVNAANIVLLVVSKASIVSENVAVEWRPVIDRKDKRIILVLFETVDLPPELEQYEWVDFRGNYRAALAELFRQLQAPEAEQHPAPEKGFKAPSIVWLAIALSAFVAVMSIVALWTLFIPLFLIPLPLRILRRSYNYLLVEGSLIMLPFALYLTTLFSTNDVIGNAAFDLCIASIPFAIALLLVLRSSGMQRWGKPEATIPLFAHHGKTDYPRPEPVSFHIEHAPQDRVVADEMAGAFQSAGHTPAADIHSARAVFTLVSAFKGESEVDSQQQVVYPVILQTNKKVSHSLSKVQWLDFRSGVHHLDAVGKLLPEPQKLLQALCIRPMGEQLILPRPILYLVYFIGFLAVFSIGSWMPYLIQYFPELVGSDASGGFVDADFIMVYAQLAASLILFGLISYLMARQLIQRKGLAASLPGLIAGMLLLGAIIYWQVQIDNSVFAILGITVDDRGYSSYFPQYMYLFGNLGVAMYLVLKRADLRRWLPARVK